ncbi:phospholipase A1-like [Zerene cesonia]|uniref:phospholipase A1-like n=1 Tax=Zerene cesonia TaxID=33412 RepID=UPI0018E500E0|nr:phospholipase A1-like [Zerene cesonia]XP_038218582.1 phospholipase A1-like [Zerene cesonia]
MRLILTLLYFTTLTNCFDPKPDIGRPVGLIPDCPGVQKNATITADSLPALQVTIQRVTPTGVYRRTLPVASAVKSILNDKNFDLKNKKTVLYAVGFLDSSIFLHNQAVGNTYSKMGYNVLVTDTMPFLSYIYPKSVRLVRVIGRKFGEFLVKLTEQGLPPEKLELMGMSLGAHIVSHAAKYYYTATGLKPSRITGIDPAGPCYRGLPIEEKLWHTDAHRVDVLHTNIDGFGIAERLGHIDFYANGGEYQPSDIPYIPCLVVCSHIRALIYWWLALENPKKFIAVKCDSIQDARSANCYNGTVLNYLGLNTDFKKEGIYYLPTHNEFPYYRGKEGLKAENEIYSSTSRKINADDYFTT